MARLQRGFPRFSTNLSEVDRGSQRVFSYLIRQLELFRESVVSSMPRNFGLDVSSGLISGYSHINKFGRNDDIDIASGYEAIWNGGGAYTGHDATAAETIEVFSADANDTSAGTGARTVEIFGLDASWEEQNETVSLNGVTAVDTANTYIRCDRAIVRTAGSGEENAGAITVRQKTTTANIFCVLPAGYNQTMICAYTVPAGKTAYISGWTIALSGSVVATVIARLRARPTGEVFQTKEELAILAGATGYAPRIFDPPKGPYAAKTDMFVEANSTVNNTGVAAAIDMYLIAD